MASMGFIVRVSSLALMVLAIERCHALLKPFRTGLRLRQESVKYLWVNASMSQRVSAVN